MSAAKNVISLEAVRALLAQRFPETPPPPARAWETGWLALDRPSGGLPQGVVTELCGGVETGALFLDRIFAAIRQKRDLAGLVDCGRTLDPASFGPSLERVLCVFCETARAAVKTTDLLLRDGNLRLVLLNLQAMPRRSLGSIPASTWHRFQRLVERSGAVFVVLTPQPLVEAARVRIALRGRWNLAALQRPRTDLVAELTVQVFPRGRRPVAMPEPLIQTA